MSRAQTQTAEQLSYIANLKRRLPIMKAEVEVLEMQERNLRASINVHKLRAEWEPIERGLQEEYEKLRVSETEARIKFEGSMTPNLTPLPEYPSEVLEDAINSKD